jgi:transposase
MLAARLRLVQAQILEKGRQITARARETEVGRRLMAVPRCRPAAGQRLRATIADPAIFKAGRSLAAWIGLVPRQNSSGGKERLGGISEAGNRYLRQMLVVGAMAVIRYAERHGTSALAGAAPGHKKAKVAAVALANKTAHIWALMTSGETHLEPSARQLAAA